MGQDKLSSKVSSQSSLEELANALLEQIGFDNDHLYRFDFPDALGLKTQIEHADMAENYFWECGDERYAHETKLSDLNLLPGDTGTFLFDDHWEFILKIKDILPEVASKPVFTVLENKMG